MFRWIGFILTCIVLIVIMVLPGVAMVSKVTAAFKLTADSPQFFLISSTGKHIAAGYSNGSVAVWQTDGSRKTALKVCDALNVNAGDSLSGSFSIDEKFLAIAFNKVKRIDESLDRYPTKSIGYHELAIVNLDNMSISQRIKTSQVDVALGLAGNLAFSPDSKRLALASCSNSGGTSLSTTGYIFIYDLNNRTKPRTIFGHNQHSTGAAAILFTPNGKSLIALYNAREFSALEIIDSTTYRLTGTLQKPGFVAYQLASSPDSSTIAAIGEQYQTGNTDESLPPQTNQIVFWNIADQQIAAEVNLFAVSHGKAKLEYNKPKLIFDSDSQLFIASPFEANSIATITRNRNSVNIDIDRLKQSGRIVDLAVSKGYRLAVVQYGKTLSLVELR